MLAFLLRGPVLLEIVVVLGEQDRGDPDHRRHGHRHVGEGVRHEPEEDQPRDPAGGAQQRDVLELRPARRGGACVVGIGARADVLRIVAPAVPDQDHHHEGAGHRQVVDEVHEAEAGPWIGPDQDVGRVADQGRRAADVGRHHHGQKEGGPVDPEPPRHLRGHRVGEDHGGDVVEDRRQHAGEPQDQPRRPAGIAARALEQAVDRPGKDVGGLEHADQRHHGEQQQDDVEVDGLLGRFERDQPERREIGDQPDQRDGTDRDHDTMNAVERQQGEHRHEDDCDDNLGDDVLGRFEAVHAQRYVAETPPSTIRAWPLT